MVGEFIRTCGRWALDFALPPRCAGCGAIVILVDDVLTTGSTAESCARVPKRAGAARVELISWARVLRPAQLMR